MHVVGFFAVTNLGFTRASSLLCAIMSPLEDSLLVLVVFEVLVSMVLKP